MRSKNRKREALLGLLVLVMSCLGTPARGADHRDGPIFGPINPTGRYRDVNDVYIFAPPVPRCCERRTR